MKVQENIEIKASPEIIFKYLLDVNNRKDFVPALDEVIVMDPLPLKTGSRYIEVANIGGRKLETVYQITEIQQNHKMSAKTIKSIFPIQADLIIDSKMDTSLLTIRLNFKLSGIFQLASGVVRAIVKQQARGILEKLKSSLERD